MGRTKGSLNKKTLAKMDDGTAPEPAKAPSPVRIDPPKKTAIQAKYEEEADMLFIPPEIIPDGMRDNWKTVSVLGQQQARRYGRLEMTGWSPVPAERHPGLFTPTGYKGNIEYDGLVLMEKSEEACRQVEAREYIKANEQVRAKEQQIRGGDVRGVAFDSKHRSALQSNKVGKSYEKLEVPE